MVPRSQNPPVARPLARPLAAPSRLPPAPPPTPLISAALRALLPQPPHLDLAPPHPYPSPAPCHQFSPRSLVRSPPCRETPSQFPIPRPSAPRLASHGHLAPSPSPALISFLPSLRSPFPSCKPLLLPWVRTLLGGAQDDLGRGGFGSRLGLVSAGWAWARQCPSLVRVFSQHQEGSAFSWKLV